MVLNILEKEEVIKKNEEDEINEAIEACQSNYDPNKYPELTKKQFNELCVCYINGLVDIYDEEEDEHRANFNELCVCYINGLVDIYDEEEDEHRANFNEPSDKFENLEEEIIKYCVSKIK